MKTIKLPIQNKIDTDEIRRVYSSCFRFCYNRLLEGKSEKEIREIIKDRKLFLLLDTWFVQSAIRDAKDQVDSQKKLKIEKCIFGGKKNWFDYIEGRITKEEFKNNRLRLVSSIGEAPQKGNRKFKLDVINSNSIIFKPRQGVKTVLQLPKLRKNIKKELCRLEIFINNSS